MAERLRWPAQQGGGQYAWYTEVEQAADHEDLGPALEELTLTDDFNRRGQHDVGGDQHEVAAVGQDRRLYELSTY